MFCCQFICLGSYLTHFCLPRTVLRLSAKLLTAKKRGRRQKLIDDALCACELRCREPFLAIGGGRRLGTLRARLHACTAAVCLLSASDSLIVVASVDVKNGVDYCCGVTNETYKNGVGRSFYVRSQQLCLLDPAFIPPCCGLRTRTDRAPRRRRSLSWRTKASAW